MSAVEVKAAVKIIPEKRTATYAVPSETDDMTVKVNLKSITFGWGGSAAFTIDKTHADLDRLGALLTACRAELDAQGVTE